VGVQGRFGELDAAGRGVFVICFEPSLN
jgi:hypothetical protein